MVKACMTTTTTRTWLHDVVLACGWPRPSFEIHCKNITIGDKKVHEQIDVICHPFAVTVIFVGSKLEKWGKYSDFCQCGPTERNQPFHMGSWLLNLDWGTISGFAFLCRSDDFLNWSRPTFLNSPSWAEKLNPKTNFDSYLFHCFPPLACQIFPSQRWTGVHFTPFNKIQSLAFCVSTSPTTNWSIVISSFGPKLILCWTLSVPPIHNA